MRTETVLFSVDQLSPHPDNPRRFYHPEEIEALAISILEMGGVEQALLIVPDGKLPDGREHFLVIDGNYRLVAAQSLDGRVPRLKCEIRHGLSRRDVLLTMARTSVLWFAKDPISEAMHYRKLMVEERMPKNAIARQVGHSEALITARLRLLDLDPAIQELVATGQLTKDPRAADALLSVQDVKARVALARQLANRRATLKSIVAACERYRQMQADQEKQSRVQSARRSGRAPSITLAVEALGDELPEGRALSLRPVARAVCQACEIREGSLPDVAEPAWALLSHAAGETCGACNLADVVLACQGCPLPETLIRLARVTAGLPR
jgi:ParB family chromosome partitioning protein